MAINPETNNLNRGLEFYRSMWRIRLFEESLHEPIVKRFFKTPCHLCSGQEAVALGVCAALEIDDKVFGNHRSHGHYLAKGGDLNALMAEVYGRAAGCSGGRGGSQHIIAPEKGFCGSVPIVAGTSSLACGAALANKLQKNGQVAVSFVGDGAFAEGVISETLNFASLYKLPFLMVCENNLYATHMPIRENLANQDICKIAEAWGFKTMRVDGNNVWDVYKAAQELIDYTRQGLGPVFLECLTYRLAGHVGPDDEVQGAHTDIRPPAEFAEWKRHDPLLVLAEDLKVNYQVTDATLGDIKNHAKQEVEAARNYALNSPFPEKNTFKKHIFGGDRPLTYSLAINEAVEQMMDLDKKVYVIGQGVKSPWYVGNTCRNLAEKFGDRVIDTPISENATTGAAIGSGIVGMKPIMVYPRMDFMLYAIDPIVNEAANWRYIFNNKAHAGVVIRGIVNRGGEQGAQHSQALQALFSHIPGLKVVMPASAYDAKGLMVAAINDGDPVVYIDDRWLYNETENVPEGIYTVPIGKGVIKRAGKHITIVAISYMVKEAMAAAEELAQKGIDAEVIDLRSAKPLDIDLILESVAKTGNLLITEAAWMAGGISAEISAQIAERGFKYLKTPITRVCMPDVPMPSSKVLEEEVYIGRKNVVETALKQLGKSTQ